MMCLAGAARLAMRASVGPILPPTPSTRMSPGTRVNAATNAGEGVDITSSRCSISSKRLGKFIMISLQEFLRLHHAAMALDAGIEHLIARSVPPVEFRKNLDLAKALVAGLLHPVPDLLEFNHTISHHAA